MAEAFEGEWERMLAERACTRILHAYCRALDWQDHAGLADLFWPDAEIDLGFFTGTGTQAVEFLMATAARSERRFHATSNIVLRVEGTSVYVDSCCITHAVGRSDEEALGWQMFFGRYLDRLEFRNGEWRFVERRFLLNGYHAGAADEPALFATVPRADGLSPDHPLFRFR